MLWIHRPNAAFFDLLTWLKHMAHVGKVEKKHKKIIKSNHLDIGHAEFKALELISTKQICF